jgi:uncharacterized membrane protein
MNPRYGDYGSWDHMSGGGWWAGLVMFVIMLALIALVAWAIIAITRGASHWGHHPHPPPPPPHSPPDAQAALDRRLVSGEIDVDEYHRLSDALRVSASRNRETSG